jgi:alpha-2-macroglobulin
MHQHTPRPGHRTRWLGVLLVLACTATACTWGADDAPTAAPDEATSQNGSTTADSSTGQPLQVRLREGQAMPVAGDEAAVVDGAPLTRDRIDAIVDRLPPFGEQDDDRMTFNPPTETLPPPVAGETVAAAFPPAGDDVGPTEAPTGPLEVVRFQPDGEVDIAPDVSITFTQPMVPLATLEQLDAADVPAVMIPKLPGRWRWIGTRTLRFEHAGEQIDRLPMATEYTVTVRAGTRSATGGALADTVAFSFATPAPVVQALVPQGESVPLEPVFVAVFDQLVDQAAVLDHLLLDAGGDRSVRLATDAEIEADDTARMAVSQALAGRWVAFRPVDPLPADTPLTITVGEGTPSAEGPRRATAEQTFDGRTFPPLSIERTDCGYGGGCQPGQPLNLGFSNPLDPATFDPATITIDPALPGAIIGVVDTELVINGATQAQTTYRVTVPAGLRDQRGQTLGSEEVREFTVGNPMPFLRQFDGELITLDPLAEQLTLSLVSAGHEDVRLVALEVGPEDWRRYLDHSRYDDEIALPDLPIVFDRTVDTGGDGATTVETIVDLADAFPDGTGHVLLYVAPTRTFPRDSEEHWANRPILIWVQSTSVGIDAFNDDDELVVWTTDLRNGSPIPGAEVAFGRRTATTDADGLATLGLSRPGSAAITATVDGQTALLGAGYVERWEPQTRRDVARWHVVDDRGLYRPGETVRLKGWVRRLTRSGDGDLALIGEDATVDYQVYDGQYAEVSSGSATLNALGGFDLAVDVPEGANLGQGSVAFELSGAPRIDDGYFEHPFQIQEFRRPEFEVDVRSVGAEPHVVTRPVTVAATATYLAGGALPNAPLTWTVAQRGTRYAPPGWEGFSFGEFLPWWDASGGFEDVASGVSLHTDVCCIPGGEETVERLSGVTDATGTHHLEIDFDGDVDQPLLVSANGAVEDVNRQAFAATTDLLVHAGERYLGLRSDRAFVRQGDPLRIDAVLTDIDGAAIPEQTAVLRAERLVEAYVDGELVETAVDPQTCEVTTAAEPRPCELTTDVGGRYRVSGTVTDAGGGTNRTELEVWVSGGDAVPARHVTQEQLTLIPARQDYVAGDVVEILAPAPFSPATGLVTVTRDGIRSTRVIEVTDGSAVVRIPLTDDMVPGIEVQLDLVGAAARVHDDGAPAADLPDRPAFATGTVSIAVPATSRTLTVATTPREPTVEPGTSTAVDVTVTAADGTPVPGADLAVMVVDEAILSLVGHELADPIASMYGGLHSYLASEHLRRTIQLSRADGVVADATDQALEEADGDTATDSGGEEADDAAVEAPTAEGSAESGRSLARAGPPIEVRGDFEALAVFAPSVTTDAEGRATVDIDLPDSLTRYRVMAVAASGGDRFGKGESTLTARLPLQVRPSAPRFANFGDAFELPVVVQNATAEELEADVVLETANLENADGGDRTGRTVTVPAGDRIEVRFPVSVSDAGTARFRITAVGDPDGTAPGTTGAADSATISLPVRTPTTAESFATYGVLDTGVVAQALVTPDGVVPQFGGLEVTTSSTALQALTDAVLYLEQYPYDSADALASRLLAIASLRDVLDAFDAEQLPPAGEIEQAAADDIAGLMALQNDDGGWSVWQRNRRTEPFHTVQATHALVVARDAGYDVPAAAIDRALERLRTIEALLGQAGPEPMWSEGTRQALRAYAVHVRSLAGDRDPVRAAEIHGALAGAAGESALPLDALAWLWPVVDDPDILAGIAQTFANQVTETPSAATFTTGYGEDAHLVLGSDRRTDGIVLDAFLRMQPDNGLIPKIVNGLIANQKQGRWDNVQENAFILLALEQYFATAEAVPPDFVARVWLGDLYAAEHRYQGRSTDSTLTVVPTAEMLSRDDPGIVLSKEGEGRLYYRLGLRTAPNDLRLGARDEGFVVQREYSPVGDADDVVRGDDGVWRIRAGAEVRVTLTIVADSRRVNMALVDPLPAGLEIVNAALAASPAPPPEPPAAGDDPLHGLAGVDWYPTWFDHLNLRDDRAEAFGGHLPAGTYEYRYVARATTPGTFIVPPATAEEIYTPEVFGRTATDTVVIADEAPGWPSVARPVLLPSLSVGWRCSQLVGGREVGGGEPPARRPGTCADALSGRRHRRAGGP